MVKVRAKWNTCKPVIKHIVTATLPCISKRVLALHTSNPPGGSETIRKIEERSCPTVVRHGKGFPSRNLFGFHSQTFTGVYQEMRKTKKRFNNKINVRTKGKFLLDFLFDISRFPSIFHVQMGCYNNINESKSAPTFPRIHCMFILADKLFLLKYRRGRLAKGPKLFFWKHTCFKRIFTFVYPRTFEFSRSSWINKRGRVFA